MDDPRQENISGLPNSEDLVIDKNILSLFLRAVVFYNLALRIQSLDPAQKDVLQQEGFGSIEFDEAPILII